MADDVIDLAAYRTQREKQRSEAPPLEKCKIYINDERLVELDHPELDVFLTFDADKAIEFGRIFMTLGGRLRAYERTQDPAYAREREEVQQKRAAFMRMPLVDKNGKPLPPLKVQRWVLQTLGGHAGVDAPPFWVAMASRQSYLSAKMMIRDYLSYGYAEHKIRIIPVDSRGRMIPPERMPKDH